MLSFAKVREDEGRRTNAERYIYILYRERGELEKCRWRLKG